MGGPGGSPNGLNGPNGLDGNPGAVPTPGLAGSSGQAGTDGISAHPDIHLGGGGAAAAPGLGQTLPLWLVALSLEAAPVNAISVAGIHGAGGQAVVPRTTESVSASAGLGKDLAYDRSPVAFDGADGAAEGSRRVRDEIFAADWLGERIFLERSSS
jgi:hypothetical protein